MADSIKVNKNILSIVSGGGYFRNELTVTYTGKVTVSSSSWIIGLSSFSSTGTYDYTFSVSNNNETESGGTLELREGYIIFTGDNGTSCRVDVYQGGKTYGKRPVCIPDYTLGTYPAEGGQKYLVIDYYDKLTYTGVPSWITLNIVDGGTGATDSINDFTPVIFSVEVGKNYTSKPVKATMVFQGGDSLSLKKSNITVSQDAGTLIVSPKSQNVDNTSGTVQVTVTGANNINYSISNSWLTYQSKSGNVYTFAYAQNSTSSQRTATVTFSASGMTDNVFTLTQAGASAPASLTISPSSLSFSADAGSEDITFRYGGDTYSIDAKEVYKWTTVSLSDVSTGLVTGTVSVSTNTSTSSRRGNIYFSSGSESVALPIEQAGISFALSAEPSSLNIPAIGGSVTTAVTYTGTLSAASLPSWLSETHTDVDANHKTYTITAASNKTTSSRTFNWRLDDSYNHCWVYFDQAASGGVSLSISPKSNTVSSSSGSVQITVRSTGISDVQYSISDSWITFGGKSGNVYTFNYESKTSAGQRTGTITFSGGGLSKTYTLTQEGISAGELTATPSSLNFTKSGEKKSIVFTYTGVLHSSDDAPDWVTKVEYDMGSSPTTYYFTVAENTSEYSRIWNAYFYDDNSSLYVPITQKGTVTPSLRIIPASGTVDKNSGRIGLTVTATGIKSSDISYKISGSWLSYSSRSGYTFYFTYTENTSSSRTATITFSAYGETATYTLTQEGASAPASLSISPTRKTVSGATGRVDITVNQTGIDNLQYTFSKNSGFVFSHKEGNVYVFSYGPNTSTLESKSASITFSGAGLSETFTLYQQPQSTDKELNLIPTSDSVDAGTGYVYVTVSVNRIGYNQYSRSINGSWLSYVSSAGYIDKYSYSMNSTSEERTATVTYTGGGLTKTYTLVQRAGTPIYVPGSLKVYPKKLRYYGEGGGIRVSFTNRPEGGIGYEIIYTDGSDWLSVTDLGLDKYVTAIKNSGIRRRASIKFYDVNDSKNYVIVPVIQGNIDGYDSIWMDELYYPENRNESGNYYYRVVDKKTNAELFTGISVIPEGYGENIGGIDTPRLVDEYISSNLYKNGSSDWSDMKKSYITVDIYNMTENGYPGVVDATFKYFNDWSRFEKRYDYTRSLNDPINGKGCDNMIIPFCVYYDDEATFSIVDIEKNGNVNESTLSKPSTPFAMRTDRFYDTKKLEYKQGDEVILSYDMDHCGPGAFIYRNRFGGWDSFLIEGNIIKTDNYTKLNYRTKGEYNKGFNFVNSNSQYKLEKHTDNVSINTTYEAYTGWLSDEEAERLVFHLLSSPMVFFQDLHRENKLYPVDDIVNMPIRITASSAEYKKFRNGKKMVNYLITFEKGHIEKVRN